MVHKLQSGTYSQYNLHLFFQWKPGTTDNRRVVTHNRIIAACSSKVPSLLGSLRSRYEEFVPKPKVTMQYFCTIPKTGRAIPIVNSVIYTRTWNKFISFYRLPWSNTTENSISITFPPHCMQSFKFTSIVLPEILFDGKSVPSHTPN